MFDMNKSQFQLFVALPTDDVCTIKNLSDNTSVYQLKSKAELKTGIPGDILRLYFMNAELVNESTLGQCKLKHGCIVRIKLDINWIGLFEACWRGDIYEVFQNGVQYLNTEEFSDYNISLWNRLVVQRATHALFIACHRGYLGLILELLNHGAADINGKSAFGRTPLHVAAYQGFVGCVSLLLSEGALIDQPDTDGKIPLTLAQENGHVYCEKRLWLYQWNLRRLDKEPTAENYNLASSTISGEEETYRASSVSRLSSNGLPDPQRISSRKREIGNSTEKETQVQLPRVQTPSGENLRSSRVNEPTVASRSKFPLVALAEKYRKQYEEYKEEKRLCKSFNDDGTTKPRDMLFQNSKPKVRLGKASEGQLSMRTDEVKVVSKENSTRNDFCHKDNDRDSETVNNPHLVTKIVETAEKKYGSNRQSENAQDDSQNVEQTENVCKNAECDSFNGKINENQQVVREDEKISGADSPKHGDQELYKLKSEQIGYKPRAASARPQERSPAFEIAVTINGVSRSATQDIPRRKRSSSLDINMNKASPEPNVSAVNKENQTLYFQDMSEFKYNSRRRPESYESWLERKRMQAKINAASVPTTPAKSHFGKSLDTETFKKWVASKRHIKLRESSEPEETIPKNTSFKEGITFERWLESKKGEKPRTGYEMIVESYYACQSDVLKRQPPTSGKRFEEWLDEKKRSQNDTKRTSSESYDCPEETRVIRNGKRFEEWLKDKLKQKQIEEIHRLTTQKEENKRREMEQLRKYLDPHCMTFEEWLEVKRQDKLLEQSRVQNNQKEDQFTPEERQEDAKLVFSVWMTMKQAQELQDEEHKYCEMKAKWEEKNLKEQLKRLKIIKKLKKKITVHENNNEYKSCSD